MADVTDPFEFPFPEGEDATNVPGDLQSLAEAVNDWLVANVYFRLSGDEVDLPDPGPTFDRTLYWTEDTHLLFYCDGVTWYSIGDTSGFLALSGGTLTGNVNFADKVLSRPELKDVAETARIVGAAGANQILDYSVAAIQDLTLDANCTLVFSNPPAAGKAGSLTVIIRQPAALKTVTWPASVDWAGGVLPVMVVSSVNVFSFITVDGGATWLGFVSGLDHQ